MYYEEERSLLPRMSSKSLCLRQHLRNVEDGASRIRKKYIKLSLDDNEVNHFIYSRNPRNDADEEFLISEERGEGSDCLAILRLSYVS